MDSFTFRHTNPALISVTPIDQWGGKEITISAGYELDDMMNWLRTFRMTEEADQRTRASNPFVKDLYDQYKTALELTRKNNASV